MEARAWHVPVLALLAKAGGAMTADPLVPAVVLAHRDRLGPADFVPDVHGRPRAQRAAQEAVLQLRRAGFLHRSGRPRNPKWTLSPLGELVTAVWADPQWPELRPERIPRTDVPLGAEILAAMLRLHDPVAMWRALHAVSTPARGCPPPPTAAPRAAEALAHVWQAATDPEIPRAERLEWALWRGLSDLIPQLLAPSKP